MLSRGNVPEHLVNEERLDEISGGSADQLRNLKRRLGLESEQDEGTATPNHEIEEAATSHGAVQDQCQTAMGRASSAEQEQPRRVKARTEPHGRGRKRVRSPHDEDAGQATGEAHDEDQRVQPLPPWMLRPSWLLSWMPTSPLERGEPPLATDIPERVRRDELRERPRAKAKAAPRVLRTAGVPRIEEIHDMAFAGPLVYCRKCARYAAARFGRGLKGPCKPLARKTANAVSARLNRLALGRHPITVEPLGE